MAIDLTKFTKGKNFLSTDFNFDDPSDKISVKTDSTSSVGAAIAAAVAAIPTATDTVAGKVSLAVAANYPEHANDTEAVTPAYYAAGFPASLSGSGYQKLPSGLIIQWGLIAVPALVSQSNADVTFPIAFPNAAFSVAIAAGVPTYDLDEAPTYRNDVTYTNIAIATKTGFEAVIYLGGSINDGRAISYIAIGY